MRYQVVQDDSKRESFAEYKYSIYRDGRLIAQYWHDHRGDEHGIDFVNGTKEPSPVGRMTDFIESGGPRPLVLSQRAIAYLDGKLT